MFQMNDSFIKTTGQFWKLVAGLVPFCAVGVILTYQQWFSSKVTVFTGRMLPFSAVSLLLFLWSLVSIRCPRCKLRVIWYAVSKVDHRVWTQWVFAFMQCPKCGYTPSEESVNQKDQ